MMICNKNIVQRVYAKPGNIKGGGLNGTVRFVTKIKPAKWNKHDLCTHIILLEK